MAIPSLSEAIRFRYAPPEHPKKSPAYKALLAVTERIRSRFTSPKSFQTLTPGEQLVYLLGVELNGEVQNGGFHQYLSNSSGDNAEAAKAALRTIGAEAALAALDDACGVFPSGIAPAKRSARNKQLDRAEDDDPDAVDARFDRADRAYYQAAPVMYERLMDYVEAHQADFAKP